jgi:hypothetical protein
MPRVQNALSTAPTPINDLRVALENLESGKKVTIDNTKEEILRTQRNLGLRRAEIPGADSHLEYIEALLIAEAEGKLEFKK